MSRKKRSWNRQLRDIGIIFLATYLLVSTLFFIFHKDVLYSTRVGIENDPDDIGLYFEDIFIDVDGDSMNCWFIPCEGSNLTVLFCHGNACNMGGTLFYPKNFHSLGLGTFMIDYRGYGRSEGEPTEEGTYEDVMAAWNYLVDDLGKDPSTIIIYGRSLGGAICSNLAPRVSPAAFVMESTFTSFMDLVKDRFFWLPVGLIVDLEYPTAENIAKAECPVMVIHGGGDVTIEPHHGKDLYDRAREPKVYLELEGNHNDIMEKSGEEWREGLEKFLRDHVQ